MSNPYSITRKWRLFVRFRAKGLAEPVALSFDAESFLVTPECLVIEQSLGYQANFRLINVVHFNAEKIE